MGRIDRIVLRIIGGVSFLLIGGLALAYANDWWLSGVMTASILCWLAGVLAAIYCPPERRPVLVGAITLALLYVTLALGPWFRGHVGPWLVTSQALTHVETKWLGRQPQVQQQQVFTYPVLSDISGSAYITTGGSSTIWLGSQQTTTVPTPSRFVEIGHWLCGWIAAAIGGLAAARMSRVRPDKALTSGQGAPPVTPTNGRGFNQAEESP